MPNLTRSEQIAWNRDFNRYYAGEQERDEMNTLVDDMMHQATHDSALFRTYDDDFEVIDRDQVMRCLANLDDAIKSWSLIDRHAHGIDAIFTALTIMQNNLKKAVEHEAEEAMKSKAEMAVYGGEDE